jgi:diguanylate cyclase (GGDEF)-like protein
MMTTSGLQVSIMTSSGLLRAQHELLECALERKGIDTVLDQALVWATTLFAPANCAVVVVDEGGVARTKASAAFPPSLLADMSRFVGTGSGLVQPSGPGRVRGARTGSQAERSAGTGCRAAADEAALWSEPIVFDRGSAAGALLVLHADARPLTEADAFALSALATSIGLAIQVAQRESDSQSAVETFASLTAAIPGVVYQRVVRPDGDIRYTYISESAYDLFGVTAAEILSNPKALFSRYSPDYRDGFRARLLEASRDLTTWDVEASILIDGQLKYTHAIARPKLQVDGSVVWTGVIMDATRIKQAEAALAAAEARTRDAIIESLSQGLLMYDSNDRLTVCNSHYQALYPELADVVKPGATYQEVARAEAERIAKPTLRDSQRRGEMALRLSAHRAGHHVFEHRLGNDKWILVNEHRTPDGGAVVLYTDVTELKLREKQIDHIAHHDALTDLPNRILFREKLEEALARARRSRLSVAVFCLDLDHFKDVNDTLGHPAGDVLLKVVAGRLVSCLRVTDMAARLGGDEFAIIVPDLPTPEFATALALRLLNAVAQPIDIDGQHVLTSASVGVVIAEPDDLDTDRLLKNADLALYRSKSDGRNTFRYFEPEMDTKAQARRALEIDLRMAITRNEMQLHYQPVVDVGTDDIVAFEALIRWTHPTRGAVAPLDFIGFAEETGLIRPLGEWILRRACTDAQTWPEHIRVAVNLSPAQFKDRHLAATILQILEDTGLTPSRLELEITESLLLSDTTANLITLNRLKDAGVRVAMDDFGTGYSSLGNLRSFPFDKIKIDQSFIKDLESNPDSAAIVRAVLSLGRSLGIGTVAEGVETREQLSQLRAEGCTQIQGFYYSKARPAADIARLLVEGVHRQELKVPAGEADQNMNKEKKEVPEILRALADNARV